MCEVRVVNRGVDTLLLNVYYTDNDKPIRREMDAGRASLLDEWKKTAQELGEPFITPWEFNEASLQMQPNGAGHVQRPWMLKMPDSTLYLARGKLNGVGAVRLSSQFLCLSRGLLNALVWLRVPLLPASLARKHSIALPIQHAGRLCRWLSLARPGWHIPLPVSKRWRLSSKKLDMQRGRIRFSST